MLLQHRAAACTSGGRYDRAIYCWQRTLDLDDGHEDVQVRIAAAYWKKGELETARQHFLAGLRLDPGNTDALLDLGELLLEMGLADEAGEKFRRVIEQSPEDPAGHFCHGRWLLRAGGRDARRHRRVLNKALQLDPTYPGAHMRLGRAVPAAAEPGRGRAEAPAGRAAAPPDRPADAAGPVEPADGQRPDAGPPSRA